MRTCFIFNSGAGSASEAQQPLRDAAASTGCAMLETGKGRSAAQLARDAIAEGFTRIIAAGGDGAIHEVLNGFDGRFDRVELAVVPLGTGNDLARSLDIAPGEPARAIELAQTAPAIPIDVCCMTGDAGRTWFLNAALGGFGLGDMEKDDEAERKHRWGPLAYWADALAKLTGLPEHDMRIIADGKELELGVFGLAIANGRYVGGGFAAAPDALLDDGLFDVSIAPVQPLGATLAAGLELMLGRQEESERIATLRARRIEIIATPELTFRVDGETRGPTDAVFEILPRALRVVAGPRPAVLAHAAV